MTKKTLPSFKLAIERLSLAKQTAVVHMGEISDADTLVQMADFFMKLAEATCSIVSGIVDRKLIVIFRNAGFSRNAGKLAADMFGHIGSAGGHKNMARAEVPLSRMNSKAIKNSDLKQYILYRLRQSDNKN